jgi:hypothetical protein
MERKDENFKVLMFLIRTLIPTLSKSEEQVIKPLETSDMNNASNKVVSKQSVKF